jgi:hypothetical protein
MCRGAIDRNAKRSIENKECTVKFTLLSPLPATAAELSAHLEEAVAEIRVFQARRAAKEEFSVEDVERLEYLNASRETIKTELAKASTAEQSHTDRVSSALAAADEATKPAEPEAEPPAEEAPAAEAAPAETAPAAEAAPAEAAPETVAAAAKAPVSFAGQAPAGVPTPSETEEPEEGDWELLASAPNVGTFGAERGIRGIARSIASVKPGSTTGLGRTGMVSLGGKDFAQQAVARLVRPATSGPEIKTGDELLAHMADVVRGYGSGKRLAEALTAAGGYTSPSERVYTFCGVSPAVNLISLPEPERPFDRGGVIFPIESDMSALLTNFAFQQHFTETELEAVDGSGDPTAVFEWSEIPAPTQYLEFRLGVIAYAIKVGILQVQGWPESVAHDIERLMVRHQHGISWRTINDMVAGSGTPITVPTDTILGTTSSVLNGLALQALNLRLDKNLDVDAPVEGVAPVWLKEVIKTDLALRDGLDALEVTDAQINGFLTARNIFLQYVDDWQTRGTGQPGNMATTQWPGYADVLLYPAGAWFRSLNPVINFGVQYPMELLKFNQYSHGFFEDAIAVGKRCDKSIRVRLPLCNNGAVGARESIECSYTGAETLTVTVTIGGTAPTGGSFPLTFDGLGGKTATIAWNSTNTAAKTALGAMDDNIAAANFTVTGGALPGTPLVITYPAELGAASATTTGLTGGAPTVTVA